MSKHYFAVQQAERSADVYIFGDIVPWEFWEGEVSANGLVGRISALDADTINVHIDSYGGAVSEGWAIYNALMAHPARIVTWGDGFVASAALFPFLAGEERYASTLSAYYLHEVMTCADGYARDLRAAADEIETMTQIGVGAFTARTHLNADEVLALMAAETWLSPDAALEAGIATAIVPDASPRHMQSMKRQFVQRFIGQKPPEKPEGKLPEDKLPEDKPSGIIQLFNGLFDGQKGK